MQFTLQVETFSSLELESPTCGVIVLPELSQNLGEKWMGRDFVTEESFPNVRCAQRWPACSLLLGGFCVFERPPL